ncbi:MAG: hypothetical protein H6R10_3566 [Rhodocyclaceae bacterium]|nr:hypothetical protein [Rhodocyclaceae bacterium]
MSTLMIRDLAHQRELDDPACRAVRGGAGRPLGPTVAGSFANVEVNVNQNINQFQDVRVNALNNVGVIGADFGPLRLDVSPLQRATAGVVL